MSRKPHIPSAVFITPSPNQKSCLKKPTERKSLGSRSVKKITFGYPCEGQTSRRKTSYVPKSTCPSNEGGFSGFGADNFPRPYQMGREREYDPFKSIQMECARETSSAPFEEIGSEMEAQLVELAQELGEIEELGKLLQEENDEIEMMRYFRDKNVERYSSCEPDKIGFSEIVDKIKDICSQPAKESPDDETQTDVAAAMLHLEEKGLKMTSSPAKIFNNLFPIESDVVSLAGIQLEVTEGVKIPMSRPVRIVTKDTPYEDVAMMDFIPSDKKFIVPHAPVSAPSSDLPELLGATTSFIESARGPDVCTGPETFHVVLDTIPAQRTTNVQMRGSQPPNWFPGYYAILPNKAGIQKYEKPWLILEKAWKNAVSTRIKPRNDEPIVVGS